MRRVCGAWKCLAGGDGSYNKQFMLRYFHKSLEVGSFPKWDTQKPQKAPEIMMSCFALPNHFIKEYKIHNVYFTNGDPNLHNGRKSSKEKRELSMTAGQACCITC